MNRLAFLGAILLGIHWGSPAMAQPAAACCHEVPGGESCVVGAPCAPGDRPVSVAYLDAGPSCAPGANGCLLSPALSCCQDSCAAETWCGFVGAQRSCCGGYCAERTDPCNPQPPCTTPPCLTVYCVHMDARCVAGPANMVRACCRDGAIVRPTPPVDEPPEWAIAYGAVVPYPLADAGDDAGAQLEASAEPDGREAEAAPLDAGPPTDASAPPPHAIETPHTVLPRCSMGAPSDAPAATALLPLLLLRRRRQCGR